MYHVSYTFSEHQSINFTFKCVKQKQRKNHFSWFVPPCVPPVPATLQRVPRIQRSHAADLLGRVGQLPGLLPQLQAPRPGRAAAEAAAGAAAETVPVPPAPAAGGWQGTDGWGAGDGWGWGWG